MWEERGGPGAPFDLPHKQGSEEGLVKKAYRKLSVQFHPDKLHGASEEVQKEASGKFIQITKAMKALTDEAARKNWEETGDPDGKQSFALGIALPPWLVASGSSWYVVAVYILLFVLVLPIIVNRWWNASRGLTKDGIRQTTMAHFYKNLREDTAHPLRMLELMAGGAEFAVFRKLGPEQRSALRLLWDDLVRRADDLDFDLSKPKIGEADAWAEHAFVLLWAHLLRVRVPDSLREPQRFVVEKCARFAYGMLQIGVAHSFLSVCHLSLLASQCIVQALPPRVEDRLALNEWMQLPYLTEERVAALKQSKV